MRPDSVWVLLGVVHLKDFPKVLEILKALKNLELETCMTLGMLSDEQALQLKEAGLDYYNHNIDTSREYYEKVIGTRDFQDRLDTLEDCVKMKSMSAAVVFLAWERKQLIDLNFCKN